jgi:hypothetical protein
MPGRSVDALVGRLVMSYLVADPGLLSSAASDLTGIGSALTAANAAAAAPTTAMAAPAADEVSTAITALFGSCAQEFHALSAQAATFHNQFVGLLNTGARSYVNTELANASTVAHDAAASGGTHAQPAASSVTRQEVIAWSIAWWKSLNPTQQQTVERDLIAWWESLNPMQRWRVERALIAWWLSLSP